LLRVGQTEHCPETGFAEIGQERLPATLYLDPDHFCVLDKKIASLAPLAIRLKREKTYIPITAYNERAYKWWVDSCLALGSRLQIKVRPVDVERGFFQLVNDKQVYLAEKLLSSLVPTTKTS